MILEQAELGIFWLIPHPEHSRREGQGRRRSPALGGFLIWVILLGLVVAYDFHLTIGRWMYRPNPQRAAKTSLIDRGSAV
jgi:hypothetical protein